MRAKLNQSNFAKKIGVTRQTVGEWERGASEPSRLKQQELEDLERRMAGEQARQIAAREEPAPPYAPAPSAPLQSVEYWRGVLFAAETMSETVTSLLRQQREGADRLAAEQARVTTQLAAEIVPTPHRNSE